jgi:hypothetical protein
MPVFERLHPNNALPKACFCAHEISSTPNMLVKNGYGIDAKPGLDVFDLSDVGKSTDTI